MQQAATPPRARAQVALPGYEDEVGERFRKRERPQREIGGADRVEQGGVAQGQQEAVGSGKVVHRARLAVQVTDGQLVSGLNFNAIVHTTLGMTHSIVDVSGIDHDGDGIVSRIYAGDLGGNIFTFKDDEVMSFCGGTYSKSIADGTWAAHMLFSASAVDGLQRKILYAPDVVGEEYGDYIFFGTGDRTDPG